MNMKEKTPAKKRVRGFEVVSDYFYEEINLPSRKTAQSCAYDIEAARPGFIPPGVTHSVPTGLKAYMLPDERLELHVRSGHAASYNLTLQNGEGQIDSDYYDNPKNEGHIIVLLRNEGTAPFRFEKGDRIAQGVFSKYLTTDDDCPGGARNGGLESTGG